MAYNEQYAGYNKRECYDQESQQAGRYRMVHPVIMKIDIGTQQEAGYCK